MNVDILQLCESARKQWPEKLGLLLSEILVFLLAIFAPIPESTWEDYLRLLLLIVVGIVVFVIWLRARRLPRANANKVGIVISISTEEVQERTRIKQDFINTLHALLKNGPIGYSLEIITIPEHISAKIISQDQALSLHDKCRAALVIYGRVRLRQIDGKQQHIINLHGSVCHSPVDSNISARFSKEFSDLFPSQLHLATENDLLAFDFTSHWINAVAHYVLGIASMLSGDLDYAESMIREVMTLVASRKDNFHVYQKLRARAAPIRLAEIENIRALTAYNHWRATRKEHYLRQTYDIIDSIEEPYANTYSLLLLKAICVLLCDRDVAKSHRVIDECEKYANNSIWLFSRAFLFALEGNLRKATQCYQKIVGEKMPPNAIADVEEFIDWYLQENPSRTELLFCLGYINLKIKEDKILAAEHFRKFIASDCNNNCAEQRQLARAYIDGINGEKRTPDRKPTGANVSVRQGIKPRRQKKKARVTRR